MPPFVSAGAPEHRPAEHATVDSYGRVINHRAKWGRVLTDQEIRDDYTADWVGKIMDLLVAKRLAKGITQPELARMMGTDLVRVAAFEAGSSDEVLGFVIEYAVSVGVESL
jgi:hypothetical protein